MKEHLKKNKLGYLFVLPSLIFSLLFIFYPAFSTFRLSLYKWDGIGEKVFVNFNNFIKLIGDEAFLKSLINTLILMIVVLFFTILIGLVIAGILNQRIKGSSIYRIIFFIPVTLSVIVVSLLWSKIFAPYGGLLNGLLSIITNKEIAIGWLGRPGSAMGAIIWVSVWYSIGYAMLFFLAAMSKIHKELYEAAHIDGAGSFKCFIYITLPSIKRVIMLISLFSLIGSVQSFGIIYALTGGGPAGHTDVVGTYLYQMFQYHKFGYASVISLVMLLITAILTLIYLKLGGGYSNKKGK